MTLKDYFQNISGKGIMATADSDGRVDAAIYSRPHIMADGTLAFIMRERLTHHNLQANPYATFMFLENSAHHQGLRLFLKKIREDTDPELLANMTRRNLTPEQDKAKGPKFIVYFRLEKVLNLIGGQEIAIETS